MECMNTGDLLMLGYKDPDFFGRRILQATGAVHIHDELLVRGRDGVLYCAYAHAPYFELIPFQHRLDQLSAGKVMFAVVRWAKFADPDHADCPYYRAWRGQVSASLKTMAELKIPYDTNTIVSMGRNFVREKVPLLKPIVKVVEHKVYCTESCRIAYKITEIDMFRTLPKQEYVSPIHTERAYMNGSFKLVEDFGLIDLLEVHRGKFKHN